MGESDREILDGLFYQDLRRRFDYFCKHNLPHLLPEQYLCDEGEEFDYFFKDLGRRMCEYEERKRPLDGQEV